jgi:hypothetical protein
LQSQTENGGRIIPENAETKYQQSGLDVGEETLKNKGYSYKHVDTQTAMSSEKKCSSREDLVLFYRGRSEIREGFCPMCDIENPTFNNKISWPYFFLDMIKGGLNKNQTSLQEIYDWISGTVNLYYTTVILQCNGVSRIEFIKTCTRIVNQTPKSIPCLENLWMWSLQKVLSQSERDME